MLNDKFGQPDLFIDKGEKQIMNAKRLISDILTRFILLLLPYSKPEIRIQEAYRKKPNTFSRLPSTEPINGSKSELSNPNLARRLRVELFVSWMRV